MSAGSGYFSSWAEGWLGGYGKARISLRVNDEGDVTGSGDFLYPIYDSERTTFFTQIGLRTMANDRVIGNFGLGQRFFLADNFALGYNAFIDQDFSRNHTRGGAGVEAWYDWLRLSANYYTPLSGWKDSEDYDHRLVEERPAEGYDARLTGYLPFYRNLAVTGAFEKWKGDNVGSFGGDDVVQKAPKVWSYGLEWTPVPAFSTSVNQRHSGSQKETQFAMTFNYHFGMDWEDQLSPVMVTEMRTVDGSRHDFVNRQNEMILEYRAKEGVYNIILRRTLNAALNIFEFQITDGFGKVVPGQPVSVTADGGVAVLDPSTGLVASQFSTDADGNITIQLSPLTAGAAAVTLMTGQTSRTFSLNIVPLGVLTLDAASGIHYAGDDVSLTASFKNNSGQAVSGVALTWELVPNSITGVTLTTDGASSPTDGTGQATAKVKSTTAQTVTVKVSATVNGLNYEKTVNVSFGAANLTLTPASGQHLVNTTVALNFTMAGPATVNNQTVTWSTTGSGTFSSSTSTTDASGVATVNLTGTASTPGPVTVRGTLDNGQYIEAEVLFGTLSGTLTVEPQNANGDIIASSGNTTLKATIMTPMFNDGVSPVAYTGSLSGLTVNWSKNGEYVYNNTSEASVNAPNGALTPTAKLGGGLFSYGATTTDASGVTTVTFTPGLTSGTAGGVQIKAELASDSTVSGTVNVAVGFEWKFNDSNPAGWSSAATIAGGSPGNLIIHAYQPGTNLPTFEQLRGISSNIGYRPTSLTYNAFWTGVSRGLTSLAGGVHLDSGLAAWDGAASTSRGVLALQ